MTRRLLAILPALLFVLPVIGSTGCALIERGNQGWWQARRHATGQAPGPAVNRDAVVQVYAARAFGLRGALGVHTWIVTKPTGADHYTRYEVMGWGVSRGTPTVRISRGGPDDHWFGAFPDKLADLRGPAVDATIARIEAAVRAYPYPDTYRTWPGPNSNTFVAWVARAVPELRLDLPPTAIGKDWLPGGAVAGMTPSGTGAQLSLFGLLGVLVGLEEGVEVNVLGLTAGLDFNSPGIKLPGIGRIGLPQ